MSLKSLLLYSLLFSYSSLFAIEYNVGSVTYEANSDRYYTVTYESEGDYPMETECSKVVQYFTSLNTPWKWNGSSYGKTQETCISDFSFRGLVYSAVVCEGSVVGCGCPEGTEVDNETNICIPVASPDCTLLSNQTLNVDDNICECSVGFEHNEAQGKCLAVGEADSLEETTKIKSLSETYYSDTLCETVEEPNTVVPNSLTAQEPTSTIVSVPTCEGSYYKCNYDTKIFEKLTYTQSGSQCLLEKTLYTPTYNTASSDDSSSDDLSDSCTFSASERLPNGYVYKADIKFEDECTALGDNITYINPPKWDVPNSLACPNTAYCFVKPVVEEETDTNTENEDDSMDDNVDLNSTSSDNQALLSASNTTNKHLSDLKDKVDLIDESLEKINETNTNLLTSSKDIKNNIDATNSTLNKSLSKQILMNKNLDDINIALNSSNLYAKSSNFIELKNNTALNSIDSKLDNINYNLQNALVGDDPFNGLDLSDDGSSQFGDFQSELSGTFGDTFESNLFGLENVSASSLQTYSVTVYGRTITFFEPSMLDDFPIDEIKALILFFSALAGFATIIRTV